MHPITDQYLLTVNGGSSSLKCALYEVATGTAEPRYRFHIKRLTGAAEFHISDAQNNALHQGPSDARNTPAEERFRLAIAEILRWLIQLPEPIQPTVFSHRVVHGGNQFSVPTEISDEVVKQLESLAPLAPLHQPYNLELVEVCRQASPDSRHIACFDTMFHQSQSPLERHYALPAELSQTGIQRYGFHGLSYEFICRQLAADEQPLSKTIICHLGSGASMCAVQDGLSVASSMGFSAVEGLPMATRTGSIDPGVLLYLMDQGYNSEELTALLYQRSGLLGVSGISPDMQTLLDHNSSEAAEAVEMFCYRCALEIGRLSAALNGVEQIVFTAGIGENSAEIRDRIIQRTSWLGAKLDKVANNSAVQLISDSDSKLRVRVIATNEEQMLAQHAIEVLE